MHGRFSIIGRHVPGLSPKIYAYADGCTDYVLLGICLKLSLYCKVCILPSGCSSDYFCSDKALSICCGMALPCYRLNLWCNFSLPAPTVFHLCC